MYLNLVVAVLSAIAGGAISLSGILSDPAAHLAVAWCTFGVSVIGVVNGVLHGYSAPQAGPAADTKPPVAIWAALALGTALTFAPSHAEAQIAVKAPSPKTTIASNIYSKIQNAALDDLVYADGLAVSVGDTVAHGCWQAWITQIKLEQSANSAPPPPVHLIADVQRLLNMNRALAPDGALAVACSPLANRMKLDVLGLLGKVALGQLAIPALIP
jgi:hypothetical protein